MILLGGAVGIAQGMTCTHRLSCQVLQRQSEALEARGAVVCFDGNSRVKIVEDGHFSETLLSEVSSSNILNVSGGGDNRQSQENQMASIEGSERSTKPENDKSAILHNESLRRVTVINGTHDEGLGLGNRPGSTTHQLLESIAMLSPIKPSLDWQWTSDW